MALAMPHLPPAIAVCSESPRDFLRAVLPADWNGTEWPLDRHQMGLLTGSVFYFWLGAGSLGQRRDLAKKLQAWDNASAKLSTPPDEEWAAAEQALGTALEQGLKLRVGFPLAVPMLDQLESTLRARAGRPTHPIDLMPEAVLAHTLMLALWQYVSDGEPPPAGHAVCQACTLVFEPVRKKGKAGKRPIWCPFCTDHRHREERKVTAVPKLAKGMAATVRGFSPTPEMKRQLRTLGCAEPAWRRSMVVNSCEECGKQFPGSQPKSRCPDCEG